MATTVVKSIGTTGRDYSTLQSWEDACPANLVTADQIWRGECYNDSEFTAGVTIAGMTTDATRYVELTVAAGQSFQDHANVRTNALRYNQSNGVGVRMTAGYVDLIINQASYSRISRLQVLDIADPAGAIYSSGTYTVIKDCIATCCRSSTSAPVSVAGHGSVINTVCVNRGTGAGITGTEYLFALGCTLVKPSDVTASGTGLVLSYASATAIIQSCCVFGFTTAASAASQFNETSSKNNATNLAESGDGLPGSTGNVYNVTYNQTTPFTDADKDSLDLRAIAATALAGAGYLDSTNAPNDISGTARAASPTIGAWELAAAAASYVFSEIPRGILRGVQRGMTRMHG